MSILLTAPQRLPDAHVTGNMPTTKYKETDAVDDDKNLLSVILGNEHYSSSNRDLGVRVIALSVHVSFSTPKLEEEDKSQANLSGHQCQTWITPKFPFQLFVYQL